MSVLVILILKMQNKTSRTSSNAIAATSTKIKRGPWTPQEDKNLFSFITQHGHGSWRSLPERAGLLRCGKSCRLRWKNYLRPDIKRGNFSLKEDQTIIQLHALLGNRWSTIAANLPSRTDNEIKNYWNTHLKKRLAKIGFDPVTHKPLTSVFGGGDPKSVSKLSHIAQWESARLQAEARLSRESILLKLAQHDEHFSLKSWETLMMPQPPSLAYSAISNPSFEAPPPLTSWATPTIVNDLCDYESGVRDCGDILEALQAKQSCNETGSFGLGDYWSWEQCDDIRGDDQNVIMSDEMSNLFMFQ